MTRSEKDRVDEDTIYCFQLSMPQGSQPRQEGGRYEKRKRYREHMLCAEQGRQVGRPHGITSSLSASCRGVERFCNEEGCDNTLLAGVNCESISRGTRQLGSKIQRNSHETEKTDEPGSGRKFKCRYAGIPKSRTCSSPKHASVSSRSKRHGWILA